MNSIDAERLARLDFCGGLHSLADFLAATPSAPLPGGPFSRHFNDADEFDKAVAAIGAAPNKSSSGYEVAYRTFGPITYGAQTNGRAAQQLARRLAAVAEREAELGLTTTEAEAA